MRSHWSLILAAGGLAVGGCYPHDVAPPSRAAGRAVDVIELRSEAAEETTALVGMVEPWREATLHFEVGGVISEVLVEEGDTVRPGDPVARLVQDDFRLALAQAQAEHGVAKAKLALLMAGTRTEELEAARAAHAQAKTKTGFWSAELVRRKKAFAGKGVPETDLATAQREYDAGLSAEREAKAMLDRAIAGPRREEIDAARAEVDARARAAALAQRQLDKSTLTAPFAGRIEKRFVDPGELINIFPSGGAPVAHLVDSTTADAVISVPETLLDRFTVGHSIQIASAADPAHRAEAKVTAVGEVADRASATYSVRARIAGADRRFRSGMVVVASATTSSASAALRVPAGAVRQPYGQPPQVLLVDPKAGRVQARNVQLGAVRGELIEIADGLSPGELLIVGGQHQVVAGDQVRPHKIESSSLTRLGAQP